MREVGGQALQACVMLPTSRLVKTKSVSNSPPLAVSVQIPVFFLFLTAPQLDVASVLVENVTVYFYFVQNRMLGQLPTVLLYYFD